MKAVLRGADAQDQAAAVRMTDAPDQDLIMRTGAVQADLQALNQTAAP